MRMMFQWERSFKSSNALKMSLTVLGNQTQVYADNLDAMGESTEGAGAIQEGFAETAQTDAFKMEQAMNNLSVAGTMLGDSLAPVVQMISDKVMELTTWWTSLDESTQTNIASWMGWVAIAGPACFISWEDYCIRREGDKNV